MGSLLSLIKEINVQFAKKSHLHLISFDIHKAFDKVWPQAILKTFQELNIGGNLFENISLKTEDLLLNLAHQDHKNFKQI